MNKQNVNYPSEKELLKLLEGIEKGKIAVELDRKASEESIEDENRVYHFNAGKWRIGVFVDCGDFDYIEYIQHGGKKVTHSQIEEYYPKVDEYIAEKLSCGRGNKIFGIEKKIFAGL